MTLRGDSSEDDSGLDAAEMVRAASMLQSKQLLSNNVISKRKEQLNRWQTSEMNSEPAQRKRTARVLFEDRDIFLSACMSGDEDEVEELLRKGADINSCTIDGLTALHQSVIDSKPDMVSFLCAQGADINAQDNEGWTPLHAAACCGNASIVKLLIDRGACLSTINSDKELAVDLAEDEECRSLLESEYAARGVDAEKARDQELVMMLKDVQDWTRTGRIRDLPHPKTGATALHVAAAKGYTQVVEMLLKLGTDVNIRDKDGWTPLHAAAHWGERDTARMLMAAGSRLDAQTIAGQNVLAVADKEIVEYLELEQAEADKRTPSVEKSLMLNGNHAASPAPLAEKNGRVAPATTATTISVHHQPTTTTTRTSSVVEERRSENEAVPVVKTTRGTLATQQATASSAARSESPSEEEQSASSRQASSEPESVSSRSGSASASISGSVSGSSSALTSGSSSDREKSQSASEASLSSSNVVIRTTEPSLVPISASSSQEPVIQLTMSLRPTWAARQAAALSSASTSTRSSSASLASTVASTSQPASAGTSAMPSPVATTPTKPPPSLMTTSMMSSSSSPSTPASSSLLMSASFPAPLGSNSGSSGEGPPAARKEVHRSTSSTGCSATLGPPTPTLGHPITTTPTTLPWQALLAARQPSRSGAMPLQPSRLSAFRPPESAERPTPAPAFTAAPTIKTTVLPQPQRLPLHLMRPWQSSTVESEAERRNNSRMQRAHRRSTQGVSKEDIELASRQAAEETQRRRLSSTGTNNSNTSGGVCRLASEERDSSSSERLPPPQTKPPEAPAPAPARLHHLDRSSSERYSDSSRSSPPSALCPPPPPTSGTLPTLATGPSPHATPSAMNLRRKSQVLTSARAARRGTGPVLPDDVIAAGRGVAEEPGSAPSWGSPAPASPSSTMSASFSSSSTITGGHRPGATVTPSSASSTASGAQHARGAIQSGQGTAAATTGLTTVRIAPRVQQQQQQQQQTPATPTAEQRGGQFAAPTISSSAAAQLNYKTLYERERSENERLRRELEEVKRGSSTNGSMAGGHENGNGMVTSGLRRLSGASSRLSGGGAGGGGGGVSRSPSATSVDDTRTLERRVAELELELKILNQLRLENQRLKEENGALVRVISKMTI